MAGAPDAARRGRPRDRRRRPHRARTATSRTRSAPTGSPCWRSAHGIPFYVAAPLLDHRPRDARTAPRSRSRSAAATRSRTIARPRRRARRRARPPSRLRRDARPRSSRRSSPSAACSRSPDRDAACRLACARVAQCACATRERRLRCGEPSSSRTSSRDPAGRTIAAADTSRRRDAVAGTILCVDDDRTTARSWRGRSGRRAGEVETVARRRERARAHPRAGAAARHARRHAAARDGFTVLESCGATRRSPPRPCCCSRAARSRPSTESARS